MEGYELARLRPTTSAITGRFGTPDQLAAISPEFPYDTRRYRGKSFESPGGRLPNPNRGARYRIPDAVRIHNG